jgi:DNA-binding Lrp family transcriptional regulator
MKPKEKKILEEIRKNSRASLTYLAYKAEMPISSTFNKLKELESSVIKKYTSIVDFKKLGYSTWSKLIIKVNKNQREDFKNFVLSHENVNSVFEINNGYDFLIETFHENKIDLKLFIENLQEKFEISSMHVIDVINDLQRERFMAK